MPICYKIDIRTAAIIGYAVTSFLLGCILYIILQHADINHMELMKLQDRLDELTGMVSRRGYSNNRDRSVSADPTSMVQAALKEKLSSIYDEINAARTQISTSKRMSEMKRKSLVTYVPQRFNYASEHLGAKVLKVKGEGVAPISFVMKLMFLDFYSNPPENMLKTSMEPGNCFAFKQPRAEVTIMLVKEILVDAFELAHIAPEETPNKDTSCAPKSFEVYGFALNCLDEGKEQFLGSFEYTNDPLHLIQEFKPEIVDKFGVLRIVFESNHGNDKYTCVYRFAVYGRELRDTGK